MNPGERYVPCPSGGSFSETYLTPAVIEMPKRRVAAWKYFSGDVEIENVRWFSVGENGQPSGTSTTTGPNARFGTPVGAERVIDYSADWRLGHRSDWLPMERQVKYLTKADRHQCDWRCMGAKPNGECWCECGGRNHGRNFRCDFAA